ncbi:MAG: hypothetical protein V7752_16705 [Halopseudomonas sp.]
MKTSILAVSLCLALAASTSYGSEPGSAKRCQSITKQIQHYTDKRRQGGSASQMQSWRKKRSDYNKLYSQFNCKRHRLQYR